MSFSILSVSTLIIAPFISEWILGGPGTITIPTHSNGTYNCNVDWGDGSTNLIKTWYDPAWTHTYASGGTKIITINGDFVGIRFNNGGDRLKINKILQWGKNFRIGTNQGSYFKGCSNLTITATDILNLTGTTSLREMFDSCTSIITIPNINNWDTSHITDMSYMFNQINLFNQDLNSWDVSMVTSMIYMFTNNFYFNHSLNNWNVSNVNYMNGMFASCPTFDGNISNWNVSNVISMSYMFSDASSFNQNIGNWDVSKLTDMDGMFSGASSFDQNISNWNVGNVTNMNYTFQNCTIFNQNIGLWNIIKVVGMANMFDNSGLSDANYQAYLIRCDAISPKIGVSLGALTQHHGSGAGLTAFNNLTNISTKNWTIIDAGI